MIVAFLFCLKAIQAASFGMAFLVDGTTDCNRPITIDTPLLAQIEPTLPEK